MKNTMKSLVLFSFVALLGLTFSSGCRKKKSTTAKIIVRDETNALVIGANVHVYGESTTNKPSVIDATSSSDYKGEAFFNYDDIFQLGQAGVAVLNIDCSYGIKTGSGIIKIEAEQENTETVYIQ
jgi:hypothetical protein